MQIKAMRKYLEEFESNSLNKVGGTKPGLGDDSSSNEESGDNDEDEDDNLRERK